jgi:hypothetical protein
MSSQIIAQDVGFSQQDEIDRLEINVERRLNGRVRNFRLIVHPDGLILQGSAVTYHAKQLAQHTVMASTQLTILANEIEVEANFAAPAILVDS